MFTEKNTQPAQLATATNHAPMANVMVAGSAVATEGSQAGPGVDGLCPVGAGGLTAAGRLNR